MAKARFGFRPTVISIAVASCFTASTALANPTGANVVRGTAAIHQAGNLLQITNSPNAIINWQSFSIGANEITRFLQQSSSSAVLNRVITQNPSTILGALQSNGRVFLINPNGILFGAGAQIDVAGLVASTLKLSDEDFLAGRLRFTDGLGNSVINEGAITTSAGGSVYLVGSGVTNKGIITSPQGEVILAAGNSVELISPGTPNLRVEVAALDHEARNLGQIISDAGRIGIYAGLINNSGTVSADSAVAEGGRILLKASKSATLESTSVLSAQGQGGGKIEVLAGEEVRVAGRLDASAPNGGDGGFIETSGKGFSFDPSSVITTAAPYGKTGTYLIDPPDFHIGGQTAHITGTVLSGLLNQTSVVITSDGQTVPSDGPSGSGDNGDIFVFDQVSWSSINGFTLAARRDVNVIGPITNTGTGGIALLAGWDGTNPQNPATVTPGVGDVVLSFTNVSTAGNVLMRAGKDIVINSSSVSAGNLNSFGVDWSLTLHAANQIQMLLNDGNPSLDVSGGEGRVATLNLTAGSGGILTDSATLTATGNGGCCGVPGGSASINLSTSGNISLTNGTTVQADGGAGGGGSSGSPGANGGAATVAMNGSSISVAGSTINATGGDGGFGGTTGNNGGNGGNGGNALVSLTASTIALSASGTVNATGGAGGSGGTGSGSGGVAGRGGLGGNATVSLTGGNISLSSANINPFGGAGGEGGPADEGAAGGAGGNGGNAIATLMGGNVAMTGSTIFVSAGQGGDGGSASSGGIPGKGGNGGSATATLAGGIISVGISSFIGTQGGSGGDGGSNTFGGGTAGNGGAGGGATTTLTGSSISVDNSGIQSNAGRGGSGGSIGGSSAAGTGGNGGNGASASVTLTAGSVSVSGGAEISASGGSGGLGGFGGPSGVSGVMGSGGGGTVVATASAGNVAVQASSSISADGAEGGAATVALTAAGAIIVDGSAVQAIGGSNFSGNGGAAAVTLNGNGITVSGTVSAQGGSGAGMGGAAITTLNGGAGGVTVTSPSLRLPPISEQVLVQGEVTASFTLFGVVAVGGSGTTGGAATVAVNTSGNITVDNSFIGAAGGSGQGTGGNANVLLTTGGNIALASNVIANGGLGTAGNGAGRIDLVFLSSSGAFSVNGVTDLIFDDLTGSGFMVDNLPAILNSNLFVTKGAPIFNDILVATMLQQVDVLADQLKAGETGGEDEEEKKLPFCSS